MHWNFVGDVPIYLQITEKFEQMIASGILPPGERLLSVREYAAQAGVNPNTMQKAFSELEKNGLVYSQRTSGRFVTDDPEKHCQLRSQLAGREINRFIDSMRRLGYSSEEIIELVKTADTNIRKEQTVI